MPKGVQDLTIGKLESLLHITDIVRAVDNRMEMQTLAIFLYVARHNRQGGITMDEIATEIGIAQSSISRGVIKLSDGLVNPPRAILDKAADKRRPPSRDRLRPRFGLGLLTTMDDPAYRRQKLVFLTAQGERIANKLMDYTVAARPMSPSERRARVKDMREGKDVHKQKRVLELEERAMYENTQRLEKFKEDIMQQLDSITKELKIRHKETLERAKVSKELLSKMTGSGYGYEGANVRKKK